MAERILKFVSDGEKETVILARTLAKLLRAGDVLCLYGELGSGKTTFTKGIAQGLRISPVKVNSPTFVLMNAYAGRLPLYHFDLYRLDDIKELFNIGYDEFLYGQGIAVVEWAEKLKTLRPKEFIKVELQNTGPTRRHIIVTARGDRYKKVLRKVKWPKS